MELKGGVDCPPSLAPNPTPILNLPPSNPIKPEKYADELLEELTNITKYTRRVEVFVSHSPHTTGWK